MTSRCAPLALCLVMLTVLAAAASDETRISAAIKELGDSAFQVREAAQRELLKIGLPAEKLLQAAARSPDAEIARRIEFILGELSKRKVASEIEKASWATVLERVRKHAASDDWQKSGFEDLLIEGAIEKLIDQANEAAKQKRVNLPVRFAECQANTEIRGGRGASRLLCAQGSHEFSGADRSIFLIDGNVRISHASDCLIIARGAVNISHGSGNVILAGQFVDISHDGSRLRGGEAAVEGGSSLVLSGSILRMSHSQRSICYAQSELSVGSPNCIFLNSAKALEGRRASSPQVDGVKLLLQPTAPPNPIRDQLKITQVYGRGDSDAGLAIIEQGGIEIVLRPGAEIKDNLGMPVAALAGWKLAFVADGYALLSNGKEDAGFVIPKK